MRTIKEAEQTIAAIWRQAKPAETVYRPIKYLLQVRVKDGLLLYHTVTGEMVLLDNRESSLFEGLPAMHSAEMDELIARHYLVKEKADESRSVKELRYIMKMVEPPKRVTGFTILPTTACNARCAYCFESDFERCTMTEKIADDVVDYIAKTGQGEPVDIGWFGGEPLVAAERITQISRGLRQKGVPFQASMVSNGYLFDEDMIQTAKKVWKLTSVQITLDGTEEAYNQIKAYVQPKDNPYRRVIRNMELLLAAEIAVNVRLNVTDRNAADLNRLTDELAEQFGGKNGFTVYSHAVYGGVGFQPLMYGEDAQVRIDEDMTVLDAKLRELGLLGDLSQLPRLRGKNCMADNEECRVIYPDGRIGKCEDKSPADSVGDIWHDVTDGQRVEQCQRMQEMAECGDCCFYPNCVSLTICPETGKCSAVRRNWKKERYQGLMRDRYEKRGWEEAEKNEENTVSIACES